jgi:hypothetical protein
MDLANIVVAEPESSPPLTPISATEYDPEPIPSLKLLHKRLN